MLLLYIFTQASAVLDDAQQLLIVDSIKTAVDIGYRHFDCAAIYNNEKSVGKAINDKITDGVVKRNEVYITSKVRVHDGNKSALFQSNKYLLLLYSFKNILIKNLKHLSLFKDTITVCTNCTYLWQKYNKSLKVFDEIINYIPTAIIRSLEKKNSLIFFFSFVYSRLLKITNSII